MVILVLALFLLPDFFVLWQSNLFHVTSLFIDKRQIVTDTVWIICGKIRYSQIINFG